MSSPVKNESRIQRTKGLCLALKSPVAKGAKNGRRLSLLHDESEVRDEGWLLLPSMRRTPAPFGKLREPFV